MENNPFLIFPEEVWHVIFEHLALVDSRDVWNLFKAYPELNAPFQKRKRLWLFGLVLPLITSRSDPNLVKEKHLLRCRVVSKPWSKSVDNFLANQHHFKAYQHDLDRHHHHHDSNAKLYWSTEPHLDRYHINKDNIQKPTHFGATKFVLDSPKRKSISRFLRQMKATPAERNPFLSQALYVQLVKICESETNAKIDRYWSRVLKLLQRFGYHVTYFKFELLLHEYPPGREILERVLQGLSYLPNLKGLNLTVCLMESCEEFDNILRSGQVTLPDLPHLESICVDNNLLGRLMIPQYAPQIRRLQIRYGAWRPEYSNLFPNLTELQVYNLDYLGVNSLNDILLPLEAPLLAKVEIKFRREAESGCGLKQHICPCMIEKDLFQWLKRFPNIQYFDVGNYCRVLQTCEIGWLNPDVDSVPSLKFLAIRDSREVQYNFLKCLPNLQHLQIYVETEPLVVDLSEEEEADVQIRLQIQTGTMYSSNIWELLPKLRTVTLLLEGSSDDEDETGGNLERHFTFTREGYVRREEVDDDAAMFAPLRRDTLDFLRKNQKEFQGDEDDDDDSSDDDDGGYDNYAYDD